MRRYELRLAIPLFIFAFAFTTRLALPQEPRAGAASQSSAIASKEAANAHNVSPDTPVITLDGYCDPLSVIGTTDKTSCRTVVTRSEFEELAKASSADSSTPVRVQLANFYAKFTLLAHEAQKRGMYKDPRFQERLELARIQLLGQALIQDLQAKSRQYTPYELQKFFRENPAMFERASLQRIYVPNTKFTEAPNKVQQPIPESTSEMKLLAQAIYARAQTGTDFEVLQTEAFRTARLQEEPVANLGKMARGQLRPAHQVVFDLKPGEVSSLFEEREEGYYVYKMGPKEMPTFESVKPEAAAAFEKERLDTWMNSITGSAQTKLNEEYFGSAPDSVR